MFRLGLDKLLLVCIAAVLLFVATHSVGFALVLVLYAAAIKFLYKQPVVQISKEGLELKKMIGSNHYEWSSFVNVILKDNLLTLDFKNNKLLQLDIAENEQVINEETFNSFSRECLRQL